MCIRAVPSYADQEVEALKLRTPSSASSSKAPKPKSTEKPPPETEAWDAPKQPFKFCYVAITHIIACQAAKENRLRRLCEQKPSGKINVPREVHARWAQGGEVRKALLADLEAAEWKKVGLSVGVCVCDCAGQC